MKKQLKLLLKKIVNKLNFYSEVLDKQDTVEQFIQFLSQRSEISKIIRIDKILLNRLDVNESVNSIVVYKDDFKFEDDSFKKLAVISKLCQFLIILDKGSVQNLAVIQRILDRSGFHPYVSGKTPDNQNLIISGKFAKPNNLINKVSVQAIVSTFNEGDILFKTIDHLLQQGVCVHILDNWSNDGSYDKALELSKSDTRVTIERFPVVSDNKEHDWHGMLSKKTEIARLGRFDWYMHYDADEIRISPWENINLQDAISFVDSAGFNAIDFTVVDFRPVNEGWDKKLSLDFFDHLEFGKRPGHFLQIKCWKSNAEVSIVDGGGHEAKFPDRKIYPLKFLMKHYPLRSSAHARKKIFQDRLPRIEKGNKLRGWHTHYKMQSELEKYIWNESTLIKYDDNFNKEYIIQRLSGLGL